MIGLWMRLIESVQFWMVLVFKLVNVMYVPVEATYYFLSPDIAIVFDFNGNYVRFCIVLAVADRLFMPVNCLYCADFFV